MTAELTPNTQITQENVGLLPCPFCGASLRIRKGVNAYGHCDTKGCHSNRAQTVPLDDPRQVAAWNRRPALSPPAEGETRMTDEEWEDRCTCCDNTGITIQTERRCACQPPLTPTPAPVDWNAVGPKLVEALGQIKDEIRFVSDPEDITLAVIESLVNAALATQPQSNGE